MLKNLGSFTDVVCDGCRASQSYERKNALSEARADGWKFRQPQAVWRHYCPNCTPPGEGKRNR